MGVFRALVVVTLLLNGMAMPPATAMHTTAGAATHAGNHASHAPAQDGAHDHHAASMPGVDCCEDVGCDCGCAVPQSVTVSASPPRNTGRIAHLEFTFVVKSFHSSPFSAPFRPPA